MKDKQTIRLNRYLAMCGIGARRKVEEYIFSGRVKVNNETVLEPGRQILSNDVVLFDNKEIFFVPQTYIIYNKPKGLLCAVEDEREQTIIDALPPSMDHLKLFPVGRLDKNSEGLIILTNDGMFSQELIHPSKGIDKTYEVQLRKPLDENKLIEWINGVKIEGRTLKPVSVRRLAKSPLQCWFEVVLAEGIKREIRLMVRELDNDVRTLERKKIGKLELRLLKRGEYISVSKEELWKHITIGGQV
ncbi:MAG: pseudouridine synthase [Synergistaceae bacterium]